MTEEKSNGKFDWLAVDTYLFDIDGTLLNTQDLVHYHALNRAIQGAYGVATTIDGVAYHGKTDLGILRAALLQKGIASSVFEAQLPKALDIVRQEVSENANALVAGVCACIPELLARLKSAGKLLGVASGNLECVGWHKIAAAGLREFFSFGCFSDECEQRSEIFRRAVAEASHRGNPRVCFVGDTPEDIRAARIAGAQVIAVSTGIYKAEELILLQPDLCVASCQELLTAWRVGGE